MASKAKPVLVTTLSVHEADQHSQRAGELHGVLEVLNAEGMPLHRVELTPEKLKGLLPAFESLKRSALRAMKA